MVISTTGATIRFQKHPTGTQKLGVGFKSFLEFSPLFNWGKMNPFLTHISSDGLVDSTTNPRKEFYHLLVALLDYCVARLPASMVKPGPSGPIMAIMLGSSITMRRIYNIREVKKFATKQRNQRNHIR